MTTMWLMLAQGWALEARGSDVKVTGPAGAIVEFRRRVNAFEDGKLVRALSDEVIRRTLADAHTESFERPGVIEVTGMAPDGKVLFEGSARVGSAASLVAWARAGHKRITAAAEGLRELNLKSERAKRRLAAWRMSGAASELPAAGQALAALAGDVEHALAARDGAAPMLSGMDAKPFLIETLAERCAALVDIAERERDLLILDALGELAAKAGELVKAGDGGRWTRAEPALRRSQDHLAKAAGPKLETISARLQDLLDKAAAQLTCEGGVEVDFDALREAFEAEAKSLEEELRT